MCQYISTSTLINKATINYIYSVTYEITYNVFSSNVPEFFIVS